MSKKQSNLYRLFIDKRNEHNNLLIEHFKLEQKYNALLKRRLWDVFWATLAGFCLALIVFVV